MVERFSAWPETEDIETAPFAFEVDPKGRGAPPLSERVKGGAWLPRVEGENSRDFLIRTDTLLFFFSAQKFFLSPRKGELWGERTDKMSPCGLSRRNELFGLTNAFVRYLRHIGNIEETILATDA